MKPNSEIPGDTYALLERKAALKHANLSEVRQIDDELYEVAFVPWLTHASEPEIYGNPIYARAKTEAGVLIELSEVVENYEPRLVT